MIDGDDGDNVDDDDDDEDSLLQCKYVSKQFIWCYSFHSFRSPSGPPPQEENSWGCPGMEFLRA